jgi:hypothetical protein
MNSVVYPVTGGMEDWAYSGSWEGFPIITQPCRPKTYNGYKEEKTMYDKNYKDALKSIMFLLEISNEKTPEQKLLGRKNKNCLMNTRYNAFFSPLAKNKKKCEENLIDGYIPRVIRLSLLLIDILQPYVNFRQISDNKNLKVEWTVGGAIIVNETFILYGYFDKILSKEILEEIVNNKDPNMTKKYLKSNTPFKSGKAIWDKNFNEEDYFKETFKNSLNKGKILIFIIYAKVDQNWGMQNMPDPGVPPQTHITNIRTNNEYIAKNNGFEIEGTNYFSSDISILNLK